jgi:hypothetical protein
MGKAQRQKGNRVEREIAKLLTDAGVPTRRVIGSGAHGKIDERLVGDLQIGTLPDGTWTLTGEVKARKDGAGFTTLERWLGDNDVLIMRKNNAPPMVALRWAPFVSMLKDHYGIELRDLDEMEGELKDE